MQFSFYACQTLKTLGVLAIVEASCLSVCHTLALYENGDT